MGTATECWERFREREMRGCGQPQPAGSWESGLGSRGRGPVWARGHPSPAPLSSGARSAPAGAGPRGRPPGACAPAALRAGAEPGSGDAGRREAGPSAAPRSHVRLLLAAHLHLLQPFPQGRRGRGVRRLRGPRPGERGRRGTTRNPPPECGLRRPGQRWPRVLTRGRGPCRGPCLLRWPAETLWPTIWPLLRRLPRPLPRMPAASPGIAAAPTSALQICGPS